MLFIHILKIESMKNVKKLVGLIKVMQKHKAMHGISPQIALVFVNSLLEIVDSILSFDSLTRKFEQELQKEDVKFFEENKDQLDIPFVTKKMEEEIWVQ